MIANEPRTSNEPRAVDLGRSLDEGEWTGFQKWTLVLAALAFVIDGLANQTLSIAINALVDEWGVPRSEFSRVAALGLIGVAIGTALGGVLGDRFGRRIGLIGSILLFGVMTAAGAFTHDVDTLMIVRFVDGLGIGGAIPNGAAFITEFTPLRRRSRAIALGMVFIPVGGILAGFLGTYLLPYFGWQSVFVLVGAFSVVVAVFFAFVLPESPRFLLRRPHRRPELLKLLGRFGYGFSSDVQLVDEGQKSNKTPVTALLGSDVRRETLALWTAFFFCLMASYTMFSWIPTMLREIGLDLAAANAGIMTFHIGGAIGGFGVGFVIERLGSRTSWIGLALGSILAAFALAALLQAKAPAAAVLTVLVVEGFFIAGIHTAVYTLAATVYPPFIRATGVGSASAFGRVGAVLSSYTGVLSLDLFGATGFFVVIGGMLIVCFIAGLIIRGHLPGRSGAAPGTGTSPLYERVPARQ
jgi:MFS transporter, AAHS family, 4-hydroxybenzoate transporter